MTPVLRIAVMALAAAGATGGAHAQQAEAPPRMPAQHRNENGPLPGTTMPALALTLTYASDLNADVSGGARRGAAYLQRLGLIADADLDRAVGWHGASAHLSVQAINGTGLSQSRVDNLLVVSGLEAEPALRLFNLWVQQALPGGGSLRVGQFTAGQEFAISDTAGLFVNSTFGWPASFATDLPSGGPSYPLAAPGARLKLAAGKRGALLLAVFAGDPAGPGGGDPQRRDLHGFNGFGFAGRPFVIGEVQRQAGAVQLRLGGWHHFDRFDRLDGAGQVAGDWGGYAIGDVALWQSRRDSARAVKAFARVSYSPSDRNPVDLYLDGGLSMQGVLAKRPNDVAGIAIGYARASRDLPDGAVALPPHEIAVELTYQVNIGALSLQPNVQWIIDPIPSLPAPASGPLPGNALVLGLRTYFRWRAK